MIIDTIDIREIVRNSIPIDCNIDYNGVIIKGKITGRKLKFPIVIPDNSMYSSFEISYNVAYNVLINKKLIYHT